MHVRCNRGSCHRSLGCKDAVLHDTQVPLLSENLFDLSELALNFSGQFFNGSFSPQLWIVTQFSGHLLDLAFDFVKFSCCLVASS